MTNGTGKYSASAAASIEAAVGRLSHRHLSNRTEILILTARVNFNP
jgi:hypothetical protein